MDGFVNSVELLWLGFVHKVFTLRFVEVVVISACFLRASRSVHSSYVETSFSCLRVISSPIVVVLCLQPHPFLVHLFSRSPPQARHVKMLQPKHL
jgi:hypothetical protein